jgi:hypothetical protein
VSANLLPEEIPTLETCVFGGNTFVKRLFQKRYEDTHEVYKAGISCGKSTSTPDARNILSITCVPKKVLEEDLSLCSLATQNTETCNFSQGSCHHECEAHLAEILFKARLGHFVAIVDVES